MLKKTLTLFYVIYFLSEVRPVVMKDGVLTIEFNNLTAASDSCKKQKTVQAKSGQAMRFKIYSTYFINSGVCGPKEREPNLQVTNNNNEKYWETEQVIMKEAYSGQWVCQLYLLKGVKTTTNNTVVKGNTSYVLTSCFVNVTVTSPSNIPADPEKSVTFDVTDWIYIAIGVLASICLLQCAVIITLWKNKARETSTVSLTTKTKHNDRDRERYSSTPGMRSRSFICLSRFKIKNRNKDEEIYETLQEAQSNRLPPTPSVDTIPSLKRDISSRPPIPLPDIASLEQENYEEPMLVIETEFIVPSTVSKPPIKDKVMPLLPELMPPRATGPSESVASSHTGGNPLTKKVPIDLPLSKPLQPEVLTSRPTTARPAPETARKPSVGKVDKATVPVMTELDSIFKKRQPGKNSDDTPDQALKKPEIKPKAALGLPKPQDTNPRATDTKPAIATLPKPSNPKHPISANAVTSLQRPKPNPITLISETMAPTSSIKPPMPTPTEIKVPDNPLTSLRRPAPIPPLKVQTIAPTAPGKPPKPALTEIKETPTLKSSSPPPLPPPNPVQEIKPKAALGLPKPQDTNPRATDTKPAIATLPKPSNPKHPISANAVTSLQRPKPNPITLISETMAPTSSIKPPMPTPTEIKVPDNPLTSLRRPAPIPPLKVQTIEPVYELYDEEHVDCSDEEWTYEPLPQYNIYSS